MRTLIIEDEKAALRNLKAAMQSKRRSTKRSLVKRAVNRKRFSSGSPEPATSI